MERLNYVWHHCLLVIKYYFGQTNVLHLKVNLIGSFPTTPSAPLKVIAPILVFVQSFQGYKLSNSVPVPAQLVPGVFQIMSSSDQICTEFSACSPMAAFEPKSNIRFLNVPLQKPGILLSTVYLPLMLTPFIEGTFGPISIVSILLQLHHNFNLNAEHHRVRCRPRVVLNH